MRSGEHIDTSLNPRMRDRDAHVWERWSLERAAHMRTFESAGLWGSINKEWHNVVEHSLVVNATAVLLAQKLQANGVSIDGETVDQASLLHDVTKRKEREMGISYDNEHGSTLKYDFLAQHGYDEAVIEGTLYTGRVDDMFVDATRQEAVISTRPLECLIVGYADARIRNTDVVSLEVARDRNKQKVPRDAAVYDAWYDFYALVEKRLFGLMRPGDITPADITNDSVTAMAAESVKA